MSASLPSYTPYASYVCVSVVCVTHQSMSASLPSYTPKAQSEYERALGLYDAVLRGYARTPLGAVKASSDDAIGVC